MCDDMKRLEEQLEKITAAGNAVDESLDAESARLRHGWMALERLIKAAEDDLPGPPDLRTPELEPPPRRRRPLWLSSATLMALAASLFVAVAVGLSMLQNREPTAKQQTAMALALTGRSAAESSPPTAESPPTMLADNDKPNADDSQGIVDDALDWDSSLDTEIAAASDAMLWIQAEQCVSDDTASSLYYRIELLRQELNENTL